MAEAVGTRGHRNTKVGIVVSDRMMETAVVSVERQVRHSSYKRTVRRTSRFHAHNAGNDARLGDQVEIEETRPLSKLKRWRITRVIVRAPERDAALSDEVSS